jgi:hypothetical protein
VFVGCCAMAIPHRDDTRAAVVRVLIMCMVQVLIESGLFFETTKTMLSLRTIHFALEAESILTRAYRQKVQRCYKHANMRMSEVSKSRLSVGGHQRLKLRSRAHDHTSRPGPSFVEEEQ